MLIRVVARHTPPPPDEPCCNVHTFAWILRFRVLAQARALRAEAFALAVLAPLVLGTLAVVGGRLLPLFGPGIRRLLEPGAGGFGFAAMVLALLITAAGLGATFDELYPRQGRSLLLDCLPVALGPRFADLWSGRVFGLMPWLAGILVLAMLLARGAAMPAWTLAGVWVLRVAGALVVLAGLQIVAVLVLVRFGAWRPAVLAGIAAVLMVPALGRPSAPVAIVLLPWRVPAAQIGTVLAQAAGLEVAPRAHTSAWATCAAALMLMLLGALLAHRWQRRTRQSARAQAHGGSRRAGRWLARLARPLEPAPRALWVRDLLLVLRRFSPAVDVAAVLSLAALAAAASALRLEGSAFWRARLAMLWIAAAVLALVALVPFVLRHQLPRAWIERAAGVAPAAIWRAKLWLARTLALPPALAGALALLALAPGDRLARALDAATVLAAAWMVASIIGLASFEIAERPGIGVVFGGLVAGAMAALLILYRALAPAWILGYLLLASTVADRATRRLRFTGVQR